MEAEGALQGELLGAPEMPLSLESSPASALRDKVPGDPSRGRGYSPRMEHAIDYKSVLDCGIHQDWTPDS